MSITLSDVEKEDYQEVEEIFKRCHSSKPYDLPTVTRTIFEKVAIDDDGKTVAYGVISTFCEGFIVLDKEAPYKDRIQSFKKIIEAGIESATDSGMERLYLIADSPEHAKVLKKHYGAQSCAGELLVIFTGE
jgi:hypothetical protein